MYETSLSRDSISKEGKLGLLFQVLELFEHVLQLGGVAHVASA